MAPHSAMLARKRPRHATSPHPRQAARKSRNVSRSRQATKNSKFNEFLEMEQRGGVTAEEEEQRERELAKKLGVKGNKLPGFDDGLQVFLDVMGGTEKSSESPDEDEGELDLGLSEEEKGSEEGAVEAEEDSERSEEEEEEEEEGSLSEEEGEDDSDKENCEQGIDVSEESESGEEQVLEEDSADDVVTQKGNEQDGIAPKTSSKNPGSGSSAKYVPPHLRGQQVLTSGVAQEAEDPNAPQIRRRVKGLLNRLAESNVEGISADVATLFQMFQRSTVSKIVCNEVLQACKDAPRGNELYAAVFAALAGATTVAVGVEFAAHLISSLAVLLEEEYAKDESLNVRNLTMLLAHTYNVKLVGSDVLFSYLHWRCKGFREMDVASIVDVLHSSGLGLRSDDPLAMKEFILAVHSRAAEIRSASAEKGVDPLSKRVEMMLDTVTDIKNNRSPKNSAQKKIGKSALAASSGTCPIRLIKWLSKRGVEGVQMKGVSWSFLLDPDKRPRWWIPGASSGQGEEERGEFKMSAMGDDVMDLEEGGVGMERLLQLASQQRMNTDARRAIFCVVMGSEDVVDSVEKILRLKLPGKQDREVMRVVVECCLQEKRFNKYYSLLASRLCDVSKQHKFSLQYCVWDQYALLAQTEPRRNINLARFVAEVVASHALSLSVIKAVDFSDPTSLSPQTLLHFRLFFEVLLTSFPGETVWAVFSRLAAPKNLAELRNQVTVFLSGPMEGHAVALARREGEGKAVELLKRCKLGRKALLNISGAPLNRRNYG